MVMLIQKRNFIKIKMSLTFESDPEIDCFYEIHERFPFFIPDNLFSFISFLKSPIGGKTPILFQEQPELHDTYILIKNVSNDRVSFNQWAYFCYKSVS